MKSLDTINPHGDNTTTFTPLVSWGIFVVLFIVPVGLLALGLIPFAWRYSVMIVLAMAVAVLALVAKIPVEQLGMSWSAFKGSLISNAILSLVVVGAVFLLVPHLPIRRVQTSNGTSFYIFYLMVSAPLQEFLYRSFMFKLFDDGKLHALLPRILLGAMTFSFLHVIYKDVVTLALTFGMGLVWCCLYQRYKNISGPVLSHVVVGIVTILKQLV